MAGLTNASEIDLPSAGHSACLSGRCRIQRACRILEFLGGLRMLTPADMERVLEHLDRRLAGIEQKLPTLATGEQVQSLTLATTAQIKTLALVTEALGAATAQGLEDL